MKASGSKAVREARAAKVAARSAQSSGLIKCYVESYRRADGRPDLRFREKVTRRTVRVLSDDPMFEQIPPLSNLLQDCYGHGGGLTEPRSRKEHIVIAAPIVRQSAEEIAVWFDDDFSVTVNILKASTAVLPVSVWCYVEEYPGEAKAIGFRLRQKNTGRKIEMYGKSKDHLAAFLSSPRFTGAEKVISNLFEKDGFRDYVLVSGNIAVDSYDVLLFQDDPHLTYLLGPTPDTAYRDAFRVLEEETAARSHLRTSRDHFEGGRYRECVLSARLAVEMACGGTGAEVKRRLVGAPKVVSDASSVLFATRNVAVHEGGTRVEQTDAHQALLSMDVILEYLETDGR